MTTQQRLLSSGLLIPGVLLCIACGSTPEVRRSGFLDDYSKLAPLTDDEFGPEDDAFGK